MFLAALGQKGVDIAERVWQVISAQGQKLIKEGKTLETSEENLAELRNRATTFTEKRLPLLRQLGIA